MSFTAATAGEGGSRRTRPPARGPAWPRRRDARFGVLAPAGRAGAHPLRPHRRAERALRGGGRLGQRRARRVSLGRRGGGGGDARGFPLDVLARRARRRRGRGVVPARTPELRRVGTRRDARRAPRGAGVRNTSVRARGTRRRPTRRDERAFAFLSICSRRCAWESVGRARCAAKVVAAAWTSDGTAFVSAAADGELRAWRVEETDAPDEEAETRDRRAVGRSFLGVRTAWRVVADTSGKPGKPHTTLAAGASVSAPVASAARGLRFARLGTPSAVPRADPAAPHGGDVGALEAGNAGNARRFSFARDRLDFFYEYCRARDHLRGWRGARVDRVRTRRERARRDRCARAPRANRGRADGPGAVRVRPGARRRALARVAPRAAQRAAERGSAARAEGDKEPSSPETPGEGRSRTRVSESEAFGFGAAAVPARDGADFLAALGSDGAVWVWMLEGFDATAGERASARVPRAHLWRRAPVEEDVLSGRAESSRARLAHSASPAYFSATWARPRMNRADGTHDGDSADSGLGTPRGDPPPLRVVIASPEARARACEVDLRARRAASFLPASPWRARGVRGHAHGDAVTLVRACDETGAVVSVDARGGTRVWRWRRDETGRRRETGAGAGFVPRHRAAQRSAAAGTAARAVPGDGGGCSRDARVLRRRRVGPHQGKRGVHAWRSAWRSASRRRRVFGNDERYRRSRRRRVDRRVARRRRGRRRRRRTQKIKKPERARDYTRGDATERRNALVGARRERRVSRTRADRERGDLVSPSRRRRRLLARRLASSRIRPGGPGRAGAHARARRRRARRRRRQGARRVRGGDGGGRMRAIGLALRWTDAGASRRDAREKMARRRRRCARCSVGRRRRAGASGRARRGLGGGGRRARRVRARRRVPGCGVGRLVPPDLVRPRRRRRGARRRARRARRGARRAPGGVARRPPADLSSASPAARAASAAWWSARSGDALVAGGATSSWRSRPPRWGRGSRASSRRAPRRFPSTTRA